MLKKFGIPTLAVIAMLAFVGAAPAQAGVHFGIGIGVPVYTYPAPAPAPYAYPYSYDPYAYSYPYPDYYYSTPYYSTPYVPYGGFYFGGHRDHDRDRGHERYEHGFRGHDGGHGEHRR